MEQFDKNTVTPQKAPQGPKRVNLWLAIAVFASLVVIIVAAGVFIYNKKSGDYGSNYSYDRTKVVKDSDRQKGDKNDTSVQDNSVQDDKQDAMEDDDQQGDTVVSDDLFSSVFALHFSNRHAANQQMATMVDDLDVHDYRYDIVLEELNYAEIDEIMEGYSESDTVLVTIHNQRDNPVYPENMDEYLDTVTDLAVRYQEKVDIWQISNEVYGGPGIHWWGTKEQYVVMLNNAYAAIKEVVPDVLVAPSGIATGTLADPNSLSDLPDPSSVPAFVSNPEILDDATLQSMGREAEEFMAYVWTYGQFDPIIDMHVYDSPEALTIRIPWLDEQLQKYGIDGQIILTETASIDLRIYGKINPFSTEEEYALQASDLVKRYTYIADSVAVTGMWHGAYKEQEKAQGIVSGFVVGSEGYKRPVYYTFELFKQTVEGYSDLEMLDEGVYRYIVNGEEVFVVWSDTDTTLNLDPYIQDTEVTVSYIVTELDESNNPIYPADAVVDTKAVPVLETPIIIKK
ncbi:MAG: hypothetical protein ACPGO5_00290 [Patescibacteria group bacterium]